MTCRQFFTPTFCFNDIFLVGVKGKAFFSQDSVLRLFWARWGKNSLGPKTGLFLAEEAPAKNKNDFFLAMAGNFAEFA